MRVLVALLSTMLLVAAAHASDLLPPGATFPAWELPDHTGTQVSSRDLTAKPYLIWFYPKAMTPGCTVEGGALRDRFAAFQARGVEVLGVSFDQPADNATFVREQRFPFRLLSDVGRTLAVAVGAAADGRQPVARRISYLVGPDGTVVKAYPDVAPATHAQDVLADLAGKSFISSAHPSPASPAR
jgi:peroxiredoxin Q/BCP